MNNQSTQLKRIIKVQSKSNATVQHQVRVSPDVHCTCEAFHYRKSCSHLNLAKRLVFFADLLGVTVEQVEDNLQLAITRGGCGEVTCYFCASNHHNGCPRTADRSTQQAVFAIHGFEISATAWGKKRNAVAGGR